MENISRSSSFKIEGKFEVFVYYEDTDFSGYVYHANYLKFMERAREHLLGINFIVALFKMGFHFVVKDLTINYVSAAKHGEKLSVFTEMEISSSPKINVTQNIHSTDSQGTLKTASTIQLVFVNSEGRPCRIPEKLLHVIKNSENSNK